MGVVNLTLVIGPDFLENSLHIAFIFLMKMSLGFLSNLETISYLMPLSPFLLIYAEYVN